jgi:hypothetical protein
MFGDLEERKLNLGQVPNLELSFSVFFWFHSSFSLSVERSLDGAKKSRTLVWFQNQNWIRGRLFCWFLQSFFWHWKKLKRRSRSQVKAQREPWMFFFLLAWPFEFNSFFRKKCWIFLCLLLQEIYCKNIFIIKIMETLFMGMLNSSLPWWNSTSMFLTLFFPTLSYI